MFFVFVVILAAFSFSAAAAASIAVVNFKKMENVSGMSTHFFTKIPILSCRHIFFSPFYFSSVSLFSRLHLVTPTPHPTPPPRTHPPPPPLPEYLGSPACFSFTVHLPGQQLFIFSSPLLFKYGRTFSQTSEHTKGERDPNLDPPFCVPEPHLRTPMSAAKVSVLWAGYHGELKPCTSLM